MNVGRGLFRAWILVSALWLIGIGAVAYGAPWALGLASPPIVLLVLGWALLWVGRGFKSRT
jgi:hypothetical protein